MLNLQLRNIRIPGGSDLSINPTFMVPQFKREPQEAPVPVDTVISWFPVVPLWDICMLSLENLQLMYRHYAMPQCVSVKFFCPLLKS